MTEPEYEPIIIKITNGGLYLELPGEPFLGDIQEVIALLKDLIWLLESKYRRLTHTPGPQKAEGREEGGHET